MPVTIQNSNIYANQTGGVINERSVIGQNAQVLFSHTQVTDIGDPTSTINLFKQRQGGHRIILPKCVMRFINYPVGATMTFGHAEYVELGGTVVPADPDFFTATPFAVNPDGYVDFRAAANVADAFSVAFTSDVLYTLTLAVGTIPVGAVVEGCLCYNLG